MQDQLMKCVREFGLDAHSEFLRSIARPSVEITKTKGAITRGCSKFGGTPDVPSDFTWPDHPLGPYRFIGQINLADTPNGEHLLPDNGLLSFFYADDENGESFWGDPDYVRVFRFKNINDLNPLDSPSFVNRGAASALTFQLGADVPTCPHWDDSAMKDWPSDDSFLSAYWDLRLRLHPSGLYLLGYPFNSTLFYDPTPGPEWMSLLTLRSDDDFDWNWHDGDRLVTFIEKQRLTAGEFSQIKSDAG